MQELDIGEVARRSGLAVSTLRFYEEKGLIRPIGRQGLRRIFNATVLNQLALITLGRGAGFTLDEIAVMFAPDGKPQIDRKKLKAKADELSSKIAELTAMRDGLDHAASCRAPSHAECPTFQRLMRGALAGSIKRTRKKASTSKRPR